MSVNKRVVFIGVPSHVGCKDNEKVDELAKESLKFNVLNLKVPFTDFNVNVNNFLKENGKPNGLHVLTKSYFN